VKFATGSDTSSTLVPRTIRLRGRSASATAA
jgi:hypothetical protein